MTPRREALNSHTEAARRIELAGVAIEVLEMMGTAAGQRCIKQLMAEQQRQLKKLDAAAAKLGAPYPGSDR